VRIGDDEVGLMAGALLARRCCAALGFFVTAWAVAADSSIACRWRWSAGKADVRRRPRAIRSADDADALRLPDADSLDSGFARRATIDTPIISGCLQNHISLDPPWSAL